MNEKMDGNKPVILGNENIWKKQKDNQSRYRRFESN
jgi:hypothetical protein